ncbi:MAG: DUF192 domain-containing protein [Parcubacteria group bacterium]|nr:DUF192 domain-containing protein [Parcubacteria group bacterium]
MVVWFLVQRQFQDLISIKISNISIEAAVADTPEKRIQGLSGQAALPQNRGLLFIYDKPDFHGIWMKDMNFPLDIIWFDSDKKVSSILENAKPETFPDVFKPERSAQYILEVNAGFVEKHNIQIGLQAEF